MINNTYSFLKRNIIQSLNNSIFINFYLATEKYEKSFQISRTSLARDFKFVCSIVFNGRSSTELVPVEDSPMSLPLSHFHTNRVDGSRDRSARSVSSRTSGGVCHKHKKQQSFYSFGIVKIPSNFFSLAKNANYVVVIPAWKSYVREEDNVF